MNLNIFTSPAAVVTALSNELQLLSKSDRARHISLSGGSTPQLWFELLAQPPYSKDICWKNLHFWWCDERCVPAKSPESNFGVADTLLFRHIDIPRENLHRIHGEESPEQEALRYTDEINSNVPKNSAGVPVFDWIHLGMGVDGHTASLFPGHTDYTDTRWITTARHPESGQKRISKTARLLMAGRRLTYLVLGKDKAHMMKELQRNLEKEGQKKDALPWPAAKISSTAGITEWYLDQPAASLLAFAEK
ncbi:MAG: 6-phosphogluconolactonase [Desulfobulbus propionicus]|nr:MAG: 6-phosphogluconolactonase [Desulfobulbus propionicus]